MTIYSNKHDFMNIHALRIKDNLINLPQYFKFMTDPAINFLFIKIDI